MSDKSTFGKGRTKRVKKGYLKVENTNYFIFLTVAMFRPDCIDKLLATENKLVPILGLLDFDVFV